MEHIYKLCIEDNLSALKQIPKDDLEDFKKEYFNDDFSEDIQQWLKYGDNETLKLIGDIDDQRFLFGDWESDLESVMRGNCYDDSRICEYIRNLEALVELVRPFKKL